VERQDSHDEISASVIESLMQVLRELAWVEHDWSDRSPRLGGRNVRAEGMGLLSEEVEEEEEETAAPAMPRRKMRAVMVDAG
jgi:hypothetical protein